MNFQEKRLLLELNRRMDEIEKRVDAFCKLQEISSKRGRGRPSQEEIAAVEQLKQRMMAVGEPH